MFQIKIPLLDHLLVEVFLCFKGWNRVLMTAAQSKVGAIVFASAWRTAPCAAERSGEARRDNLCAVTKTTPRSEEDRGLQKSTALLLHAWKCTQVCLGIFSGKGEKSEKNTWRRFACTSVKQHFSTAAGIWMSRFMNMDQNTERSQIYCLTTVEMWTFMCTDRLNID